MNTTDTTSWIVTTGTSRIRAARPYSERGVKRLSQAKNMR
jgi:hypothetical protein